MFEQLFTDYTTTTINKDAGYYIIIELKATWLCGMAWLAIYNYSTYYKS